MKIVINTCHGGFSLSPKAVMRYAELSHITLYYENEYDLFHHFYRIPVDEFKRLYSLAQESHEFNLVNSLYFSDKNIPRTDSALVQTVEELGQESWGEYAELKVVEIPDDVQWTLKEHNGVEHIAEVHRVWF